MLSVSFVCTASNLPPEDKNENERKVMEQLLHTLAREGKRLVVMNGFIIHGSVAFGWLADLAWPSRCLTAQRPVHCTLNLA